MLSQRRGLYQSYKNPPDTTYYWETSLLRRLQAQTLPDEAPPIGNIHPFSKMAINLEPLMGF